MWMERPAVVSWGSILISKQDVRVAFDQLVSTRTD
jgi:hypothetical protein